MPYILGDSFGDLQRGENAADSNRRMALASAMNNATQGLQFMTKQRGDTEQQAQAQQNWAKQFKLQQQAQSIAEQRMYDEEARYADQAALGKGYLAEAVRQGDRADKEGTAAGNRERQAQFARAYGEAQNGIPGLEPGKTPEEHFAGQGFSPGEVKTLAGTAMATWQQQQDAYDKAASVADTLNHYDELNARIAAADKKVKSLSGHVWNSSGYEAAKQELDHLTASKATMDQYAPRLQKAVQDTKHPFSSLIAPPTSDGDSWNVMIRPPRRNPYAWQAGDVEAAYGPGPEAPVDTSADTGGELTPVPRQSPAGAMVPRASAIPSAATGTKYHPMVYTRAYQLMGAGTDPATAMRTALQEFQSAQAQGSVP